MDELLKTVTKITGYLSINSNADLKAPALTSVGGNLSINSNADLKALTSVGGYLYINSNADLKAPALTSVGGNLSINSNADLKALTSVGGYLYINSNADLKALTSVGGNLSINSNADLKAPALTSVGGNLSINSNADLKAPALTSVGGNLYINSKISIDLAKRLWGKNRRKNTKWIINQTVPEWLIKRVATKANSIFKINDTQIPFEWFEKIRKDLLSPGEVFAIDNIEHRRVAYEMMDKSKMKQLTDYKVLDRVEDDGHGNPMQIVSFTVQNMNEPLLFYNCFCPSTHREYFVGTDKNTCNEAKAGSFGLESAEFVNEW